MPLLRKYYLIVLNGFSDCESGTFFRGRPTNYFSENFSSFVTPFEIKHARGRKDVFFHKTSWKSNKMRKSFDFQLSIAGEKCFWSLFTAKTCLVSFQSKQIFLVIIFQRKGRFCVRIQCSTSMNFFFIFVLSFPARNFCWRTLLKLNLQGLTRVCNQLTNLLQLQALDWH